jgi:hypothetical protein
MIMLGCLTGVKLVKGLVDTNVRRAVEELAPRASRDTDLLAFDRGLSIGKMHLKEKQVE